MKKTEAFFPNPTILKFGEILQPDTAEPPILSSDLRLAVRQWMVELNPEIEAELLSYGLRPRRTAILCGPPGCGKTTLAHHFGARLGLPIVLVNLSRLVSQWVGQSAQNVNALFSAVQEQHDRCILFLDEFDAVATSRSGQDTSASKEKNSIAISLLQHIDSFSGIMLAATNRGDDIDPAIWRRFGMHLYIREPDDDARFAILTRYLFPLILPEKSIDMLCKILSGASPAVLRQIMEGIKRDMVLAPRYGQEMDAKSIFRRLIVAVRPHATAALPTLWSNQEFALEQIEKMPWPPTKNGEITEYPKG